MHASGSVPRMRSVGAIAMNEDSTCNVAPTGDADAKAATIAVARDGDLGELRDRLRARLEHVDTIAEAAVVLR